VGFAFRAGPTSAFFFAGLMRCILSLLASGVSRRRAIMAGVQPTGLDQTLE